MPKARNQRFDGSDRIIYIWLAKKGTTIETVEVGLMPKARNQEPYSPPNP